MKRFLRTLAISAILLLPMAASAQIKFLPTCATTDGNCGITDILAVFINVAEFLLGITGAVALGFFVYGGFTFVISRGNKAKVDEAFTILRNAVIGIAIIFTAGVIVRFTTQALTGGSSAIPTIGETCSSSTQKSVKNGDGLWVSIPAGHSPDGAVVPEGLVCIKKDDCVSLNGALNDRNRADLSKYSCIQISGASSCVRGLCASKPSDYACCLK